MSNNKFSIIVRIYNAAKYLNQCIESVISQTYSNWELVLVNDGSTDSSLQICENYASQDERIKVVSQENQGGVVAQLTGFSNATGDYICSLDADDWYEKNLLEICAEKLQNNSDIDLIIFGYKRIYEDGTTSFFSLTEQDNFFDTKQLVSFIMTSTAHALWLKIYKKELIEYTNFENTIIMDDGNKFKSNNDLFIGTPFLFNSKKAIILSNCPYNYRILSNSISHKIIPYKRIETSLNTMEYFYKIFKEKNFFDNQFLYLIHHEILRELAPEFYNVFRYFKLDLKKIKEIQNNEFYRLLLKEKQLKSILKEFCIKQRIAFFLFTKVL